MVGDYIVLLKREEILEFGAVLAASQSAKGQRLGRKIQLYLSPHPPTHCADCGEVASNMVVSPESSAMVEVLLEGFRAIEAQPRHVCIPCSEIAQQRVDQRRIADGELPNPQHRTDFAEAGAHVLGSNPIP